MEKGAGLIFRQVSTRAADRSPQPGGFVLIMVLVVIMLASMVAASLLFVLSAEQTAAAAGERGEQSRAAAMSGVYQGLRVAAAAVPGSLDWQENPALFQDQLVYDDGLQRWYFSVYSLAEGGGIRYGLTDENSKINIYYATPAMLESVPNLTTPLVASLLSSLGAGLPAASAPAASDTLESTSINIPVSHQPWSCLEELLNIDGFTMSVLYGSYEYRSGRRDGQGGGISAFEGADYLDRPVDGGVSQFLTVCSYNLNRDNEGHPRVNLSNAQADLSNANLPEGTSVYLEAMHRAKQSLAHPVELLEATGTFKDEKGADIELSSGIGKAELPILLDRCTATNQNRLVGRINLNTAPAEILAALPGMNLTMAEAIVSARVGLSPEASRTPAWLYQEGILNADIFRQVAPYLTTRSSQFHFFVASYAIPAGNYRVMEVVVDAAVAPPAVLMLRDVTSLGLPFIPGSTEQASYNPPPTGDRW